MFHHKPPGPSDVALCVIGAAQLYLMCYNNNDILNLIYRAFLIILLYNQVVNIK